MTESCTACGCTPPAVTTDSPPLRLSEPELAVLRLLVTGMTQRAVGRALGVPEHAIEMRLRRARVRLGVGSNIQIIHKATKAGLL